MIYTVLNNRKLKYKSPFIDYIIENNSYSGENLIYTNKYSNGTFSITNPNIEYKNSNFINGYPHFNVPLDICLAEISHFINNKNIYHNKFYIRYGDTHPHKPIPKLAQIRNLLIENSIFSLIDNNVIAYYGIGDISIKTLKSFAEKYSININEDDIFKMIVNNNISNEIKNKLLSFNKETIIKISSFLKKFNLPVNDFMIESKLYKNQDLYLKLKNDKRYQNELKANGEIKYSLQELMFIYSILQNDNDVLINIIGANQSDHVFKVNEILKNSNPSINCRFLTYEICRNADERDYYKWNNYLDEFISKNNLNVNRKRLTASTLLKIIVTTVGNDVILDYKNLNKYLKTIKEFCKCVNNHNFTCTKDTINSNNHLLCKMALVHYNLNRSIEMGNQNYFYKYLLDIIKEYEMNKEKYSNIQKIYHEFVQNCYSRLGFNELIEKVEWNKVLKK